MGKIVGAPNGTMKSVGLRCSSSTSLNEMSLGSLIVFPSAIKQKRFSVDEETRHRSIEFFEGKPFWSSNSSVALWEFTVVVDRFVE